MELIEDYISNCCEKPIYGKGENKGLYCSGCNEEVFIYKDKELKDELSRRFKSTN